VHAVVSIRWPLAKASRADLSLFAPASSCRGKPQTDVQNLHSTVWRIFFSSVRDAETNAPNTCFAGFGKELIYMHVYSKNAFPNCSQSTPPPPFCCDCHLIPICVQRDNLLLTGTALPAGSSVSLSTHSSMREHRVGAGTTCSDAEPALLSLPGRAHRWSLVDSRIPTCSHGASSPAVWARGE